MYTEKLAQIKSTFSPKMILAVSSTDTEAGLRKVIEKYHIHIDTAEEVFSVLMLLAYGVMGSNECFNIINNMQVVNTDDFVNLIKDINVNILNPIAEKLKNEVTTSANSTQVKYDEKLVNPVEKTLVSDEDSDETAEQILARIDKEVDDEIEAEIRAEMAEEAQIAKQKAEAEAKELEDKKMMHAQNIVANEQNESTQKVITADFDLDEIPKSSVPTYTHTQNSVVEEKNEPANNSQNNSLSFIEARAKGDITSTTSNNYMKDPYHEEL